jgi:hypothetical protein
MSAAVDRFIAELRADPCFAECAQSIADGIAALDIEADGNPHALQFFEGVCWIMNRRERPLRERVEKISELAALRGRQVISMREFCGW